MAAKPKIFGTTFFSGKGAQDKMFNQAEKEGNEFYCSVDLPYTNSVGDADVYKSYGSFKDAPTYLLEYEKRKYPTSAYEIIGENQPVVLYNDLEWKMNWANMDLVLIRYLKAINFVLNIIGVPTITIEDLTISTASKENKGSLHVTCGKYSFKSNEICGWVIDKMFEYMLANYTEYYYYDKDEKKIKCFVDGSVYTVNRNMRMIGSYKIKNEEYVRPFVHYNIKKNTLDFMITHIPETSTDITNMIPKEFKTGIKNKKQKLFSTEYLAEILKQNNIDGKLDGYKLNGSICPIINSNETRECSIGGEITHNQSYLVIKPNDKIVLRCHSENCKDTEKILDIPENEIVLYDKPPFHIWKPKIVKDLRAGIPMNKIMKELMPEMNQYFKFIEGGEKAYIKIRTSTNVEDICNRITGSTKIYKTLTWGNKFVKEFLGTYCSNTEKIFIPGDIPTITTIPKLWIDYVDVKYTKEVFEPYAPNSEFKWDQNCFNTFDGLEKTWDQVAEKCNEKHKKLILEFIMRVWANNDENLYRYILCWFSSIIQNPKKKLDTIFGVRGKERMGKGIVFQAFMRTLGLKYCGQPTQIDDVFGKFNEVLCGKLFIFLDEIVYGGSTKEANVLKKLVTEEKISIEKKYGPKIELKNCLNLGMASNDEQLVKTGENASRFQLFEVTDYMLKLKGTELELEYINAFQDIDTFAYILYTTDITRWDSRKIIHTNVLLEHKLASMNSIDQFMADTLNSREYWFYNENKGENQDIEVVKDELFTRYSDTKCGQYKIKELNKTIFWIYIRKHYHCYEARINQRVTDTAGNRKYSIMFPSFARLKQLINERFGGQVIN